LTAMNKGLSKLRGTGSTDSTQVQSLVDEGLSAREQTRRQEEMAEVAEEYPDWQDQVSSPEFAEFMESQPKRFQRQAAKAWDSGTVLNVLDKFQEHKAAKATEAERIAREEAAKATQRDTRQQRIRDAVQPTGTGGHPPPAKDEDDFTAGYNQSKQ
jgi:hypothetical protein